MHHTFLQVRLLAFQKHRIVFKRMETFKWCVPVSLVSLKYQFLSPCPLKMDQQQVSVSHTPCINDIQNDGLLSGSNDYITTNNVVTFDPQSNGLSAQQCINIQIINDNILEAVEMFFVDLESSNPDVSVDISANRAMVVIMDDDSM